MNNTNPLIPSGSILEQKRRRKTKILYTVFGIVALHVVPISGLLLMQGCKREQAATDDGDLFADGNFQALDTNGPYRDFFESADLSVPIETNLVSDLIAASHETPTNSPAERRITPTPLPAAPAIENRSVPAPPPVSATPQYVEHTVVPNDMFYSLAKKYGTTVKGIAEANPGATPTRLRLGQVLLIPKGPATGLVSGSGTSSQAPARINKRPETGTVYTVKKGDTLTRIASKYEITLRNLRNENQLTGDLIRVGQKLKIPAKTPQVMAKRN